MNRFRDCSPELLAVLMVDAFDRGSADVIAIKEAAEELSQHDQDRYNKAIELAEAQQ
jgi:hypothetical protein